MSGLSATELRWVQDRGAAVFGLTPKQMGVLVAALRSDTFSYQEIAETAGMTRQGVQHAITVLQHRQLLAVKKLRRGFESEVGTVLRELLSSRVAEAAQR